MDNYNIWDLIANNTPDNPFAAWSFGFIRTWWLLMYQWLAMVGIYVFSKRAGRIHGRSIKVKRQDDNLPADFLLPPRTVGRDWWPIVVCGVSILAHTQWSWVILTTKFVGVDELREGLWLSLFVAWPAVLFASTIAILQAVWRYRWNLLRPWGWIISILYVLLLWHAVRYPYYGYRNYFEMVAHIQSQPPYPASESDEHGALP